ncbi:aldo/keto reductase [Orrella sp. JC864]|uniref:aldo/keto reductase n=1 Tax=Orrella sp. JC864 TaxID=3120298 RepID=UPI00300A1592
MTLLAASGRAPAMPAVTLPDGAAVPALGQGTWFMGERPERAADEVRALQLGLDLGMRLIDTAEMYADGGAETIVGQAIAGRRDEVFLVSKVYPHNAGGAAAARACEASLRRLGTDRIDLYLLHWPGRIPLQDTIAAMQRLQREGKILRWGVSNFDAQLLDRLLALPGGRDCAVNQVLYHLASRGIDYDLRPLMRRAGMPVMAYCPLAQGGRIKGALLAHPALQEVARRHGATAAQVALAWTLREGGVIAIPKAVDPGHVRENAKAAALRLDQADLRALDAAFPPPSSRQPLDVV